MNLKFIISFAILINLIIVASSYAYIDPNTGGFFFQSVAPFVYGILGVIVVFWKRLKNFTLSLIGRKKDKENSLDED